MGNYFALGVENKAVHEITHQGLSSLQKVLSFRHETLVTPAALLSPESSSSLARFFIATRFYWVFQFYWA